MIIYKLENMTLEEKENLRTRDIKKFLRELYTLRNMAKYKKHSILSGNRGITKRRKSKKEDFYGKIKREINILQTIKQERDFRRGGNHKNL